MKWLQSALLGGNVEEDNSDTNKVDMERYEVDLYMVHDKGLKERLVF